MQLLAAPEERRPCRVEHPALLNPQGLGPVVVVVPACAGRRGGCRCRRRWRVVDGAVVAPAIARSWFGLVRRRRASGVAGAGGGAAGRFCAAWIARRAFLFASAALACARRATRP